MDLVSVEPRDLSFHLLEEITDGFSEERKLGSGGFGKVYMGVLKDGEKIAVKLLHPLPGLEDSDQQFQNEFDNLVKLRHQNIVHLVGYCYEIQKRYVDYNGRNIFAEDIRRVLCFEYMQKGSLDKYLSDECSGHGWNTRYAIIRGICKGLKYLHEELESPIYHLDLKPANVLLDEDMTPKIADFGLSRFFFGEEQTQVTKTSMGTLGYLPPEYIERGVISNKFDIFSLGVVIIKIMTGPKGYSRSAEMLSHQFSELVNKNWRSRFHSTSLNMVQSYLEQVKTCIEIALSCVEADRQKRPDIGYIVNKLDETEMLIQLQHALSIDAGSSLDQISPDMPTGSGLLDASPKIESGCLHASPNIEGGLLDIHPCQLDFLFEPNKLISCPLRLTNNLGDQHVAFRCVPKTPEIYLDGLSQFQGVLPPRSTCTYVLTMEMQQHPPTNMDALSLILESCVVPQDIGDIDDYMSRQGPGHAVRLMAICGPAGKTVISEPIRPRIKIIYCRDEFRETLSMDVHPTEPWILGGHCNGYVSIWNYETQERVISMRATKESGRVHDSHWILSIKFIPRRQWFVTGGGNGYIQVFTCMTMDELTAFKAHSSWVESLAIHPSQPFVLSASADCLIKLWDWENDWTCVRTFSEHSDNVQQVMFNPWETNTFGSVSKDCTAKVWSITSGDSLATLSSKSQQVCVDFFPPSGNCQYMITGSVDGTARIWNLEAKKCVRQLKGLQHTVCGCTVGVVHFLPDHPTLVTVSADYAVSFRDPTTYRSMRFTLDYMEQG
ncbi:uncharacterized protein [Aegilops tauschii subsp. strangulata]|uniref:Protein kinase domain-containing protein n=1 Tax=Aegilops tauschii subsp. strangulata TaxID=200361 RepID=A0A453MIE6_AEGTS|nr:uncharacterized protein LOC109770508 isoform X2 [Aegilops tauschii subsp. strangulata]